MCFNYIGTMLDDLLKKRAETEVHAKTEAHAETEALRETEIHIEKNE